MNPLHYRDMIIRATQAGDMRRIDQLAAQLAQAEEARRLLQALTHCPACVSSATARLPPAAPPGPPTRVVTLGLSPARQEAYNRKHQLGAYDPAYLVAVAEWNSLYAKAT